MSHGKVLVVDDETAIRHLLAQLLGMYDFEAQCACDGAGGIELVNQWSPHAIILDLMLPDVNGYDVCHAVRSNERIADVPILMLTGLHGQHDRVRGFQAGADIFMTKPFQPLDLIDEIRALLALREAPRTIGLRKQTQLEFRRDSEADRSVSKVLNDLVLATPLSLKAIERAGEGLREIVRRLRREPCIADTVGPVVLCLQCFTDRVEFRLVYSPADDSSSSGRLLHQLLEISPNSASSAITEQLADDVQFDTAGTYVALTKHFTI